MLHIKEPTVEEISHSRFRVHADVGGGAVVPSGAVEMEVTDFDDSPVYYVHLKQNLKLIIRMKPEALDSNA